jgi:xanthine dehydrogenase YagR molybdenum-binding subunit
MSTSYLGKPVDRVDARAKVTGAAIYAAEYNSPNLAYGVVVSSAIAKGRISSIDTRAANEVTGVLRVFTHANAPRQAIDDESYQDEVAPPGSPFRPLYDVRIRYSGQPIALVVADTFEAARYAASLVRVDYKRENHKTDFSLHDQRSYTPENKNDLPSRGDADRALQRADIAIDAEYYSPMQHHNPMELFATTVIRSDDGKFTVYDKTQGVQNIHGYLCRVFKLSSDDVRVVSPYVGGAFGAGLRPQYQLYLAVLAARELGRSVRVSLTRQQMFTFGYRPETFQRLALGASRDGTLQAIIHEVVANTSQIEEYAEAVTDWTGMLYQCANVRLNHKLVRLDLHTPIDMRAPGAAWGMYALECAMDELAAKLSMDPVELRLKNYAQRDQSEDKPFSSKELRACYAKGAERFGWNRRNPEPRSMRDGDWLIGWGMAGGVWEAMQEKAAAKALLTAEGKLVVSSATSDIGTGTCTIMTQLAAETIGLPLESVKFILGDSTLPESPVEGGSYTASTVGSAVHGVANKIRAELFSLAQKTPESPLAGIAPDEMTCSDGYLGSKGRQTAPLSVVKLMQLAGCQQIERTATTKASSQHESHSCYSHSAIFAEVRVDKDLGVIRVPRIVSAVAAGRILNPKTARSQIIGGTVWGIGMALEEKSVIDHEMGRIMTHNLADYHVAVNADVGDIDVIFVDEHDEFVNPIGAKGLGEIGLVGVAAAIANAIYHATGKRIRNLPITLDQLL